jgi:Prokaryotic membrane lipoprotein lipid attachment site
MRRIIQLTAIGAVFVLAGCEGHQAKVDALQKEYDRLGAEFQKDCSQEYLKVPPTLSPKCADEKQKTEDAGKKLQAERAKQ